MENTNHYLLMEVADQSAVKIIDVREDYFHMGFEPQSELELKDPGKFSANSLVGTLSGKAALHQFKKGDLVAVRLIYYGYRDNGEFVNRIIIKDIKLVKELDQLYL